MVESGGPRQPAAGGRPRGRPHPPAPEAPRTHSPADAWAKRQGASSHAYSLLLKDSMIYGGGRMLQKFLTALMLPLFTAFLTKSDYGIVGMVVTVTTFLDVFVTLGFDVAFTRFYFDDKSPKHRSDVITHVFYVKCLLPGDPARRPHGLHAVDLEPAHGRQRLHDLLRHRRRHALLHQPERPAVHAHAPRAPAVDVHLVHHRPGAHPGADGGRLPRRVPLGPGRLPGRQPGHGRPAQPRRACRSTSRGSASSGTGR